MEDASKFINIARWKPLGKVWGYLAMWLRSDHLQQLTGSHFLSGAAKDQGRVSVQLIQQQSPWNPGSLWSGRGLLLEKFSVWTWYTKPITASNVRMSCKSNSVKKSWILWEGKAVTSIESVSVAVNLLSPRGSTPIWKNTALDLFWVCSSSSGLL